MIEETGTDSLKCKYISQPQTQQNGEGVPACATLCCILLVHALFLLFLQEQEQQKGRKQADTLTSTCPKATRTRAQLIGRAHKRAMVRRDSERERERRGRCMCIRIFMCIYIYMYMHIYIYMCIYIYTYLHTFLTLRRDSSGDRPEVRVRARIPKTPEGA